MPAKTPQVKAGFNYKIMPLKGFKHSEKTKEKISKAKRGQSHPQTDETREKISKSHKGKHYSLKTEFKKGHPIYLKYHSEETKRKIGLKNKGRKHTEESRKNMSIAFMGRKPPKTVFKKGFTPWNKGKKVPQISKENNWRWIKDRSLLKTDRLRAYDTKYKYWMLKVKKRDNWKCKINNQDCKGQIQAHHILRWKDFPELRYEINNGITLCQFHHPKKRIEEQKLILFFQNMVEVK